MGRLVLTLFLALSLRLAVAAGQVMQVEMARLEVLAEAGVILQEP
jgi:hypothetical protein